MWYVTSSGRWAGPSGDSSSSPRRCAAAATSSCRCGGRPRSAGRGSRRGPRSRGGRVGEHLERDVGVDGDHDLVESLARVIQRDDHPIRQAVDSLDRCAEADPVEERCDQRLHVAVGPSRDRPPRRPVTKLKDAVVVEELGEEARREVPHLGWVRGPDRRGLRDEQPLDEVVRVAAVRRGSGGATVPGRRCPPACGPRG